MALDGTKIKANASKHRSRTYERIKADEEALRRQVRRILRKAERVDQEEGELYGKDKNPYLPPLRPDWKERLKRLREARKAVEERAKKKGKNEPDPKTQYNFTDPDSRIMQESANKGAYVQGYNAQAAVDAKSQVIVSRFSRRRTRTTSTWPRCWGRWSGPWELFPARSGWMRGTSARPRSANFRREGSRSSPLPNRGGWPKARHASEGDPRWTSGSPRGCDGRSEVAEIEGSSAGGRSAGNPCSVRSSRGEGFNSSC